MAAKGGQPGNKNAVKNRPWAEAINRVLLANDGAKMRALAEKIVEKALEGDVAALKEVGDRSDGKPAQQVQIGGDGSGDPVVVEVVRFADKTA